MLKFHDGNNKWIYYWHGRPLRDLHYTLIYELAKCIELIAKKFTRWSFYLGRQHWRP